MGRGMGKGQKGREKQQKGRGKKKGKNHRQKNSIINALKKTLGDLEVDPFRGQTLLYSKKNPLHPPPAANFLEDCVGFKNLVVFLVLDFGKECDSEKGARAKV